MGTIHEIVCIADKVTATYSRLSSPTVPYDKTEEDPVRTWQSPWASDKVKPLLQIVPQYPAKKISTRPAVRYLETFPLFDTNLTVDVPICV